MAPKRFGKTQKTQKDSERLGYFGRCGPRPLRSLLGALMAVGEARDSDMPPRDSDIEPFLVTEQSPRDRPYRGETPRLGYPEERLGYPRKRLGYPRKRLGYPGRDSDVWGGLRYPGIDSDIRGRGDSGHQEGGEANRGRGKEPPSPSFAPNRGRGTGEGEMEARGGGGEVGAGGGDGGLSWTLTPVRAPAAPPPPPPDAPPPPAAPAACARWGG